MKAYRIVEIKDGIIKSLFHGTNGSRSLPCDVWIKANRKTVRDGSHGKKYLAGFHFLKDKETTQKFFNRNFKIKKNRHVVPCEVRKNIRIKPTGTCWLADEIKFNSKDIKCDEYNKKN